MSDSRNSSGTGRRANLYFSPEGSSQDRWIALSLFAASCLYLRLFYHYTTYHTDEGIVLQGAQRILEGQVLYRDFFSFYTPASYYWMALLFKVFGSSILVGRAALMVYGGLFSLLTYLLARRVCARWSALLASYMVALTCLPFRFTASHNWDSTLTAYLTLYCAVLFLERAHWALALGTGSLAAVTVLFEQSKGGGLVLGLVLGFLAIARSEEHKSLFERKRMAALAIGFAWPFLATLGYFWSQHSLPQALEGWFWPLRRYAAVNALPFGYSPLFAQSGWTLLGSSLVEKSLVVLITAPFVVLPFLPIVALSVFGVMSIAICRSRQCNGRRAYYTLVSATLAGLLLELLVTGRPDITYLTFLGPLFYLVVAWAVDSRYNVSRFRRSLTSVGAVVLFLAYTAFGMSLLWGGPLSARYWVTARRGALKSTEPELMVQYIQAHVSPGEKIFAYPYQPLYYYLTETVNATPYEFLQLGLFNPDQFQEAIHRLEIDQTRVVLIDPYTNQMFQFISPATPAKVLARPDPVADYVLSHYRPCVWEPASHRLMRSTYMVRKDLACPSPSLLHAVP